MSELIKLDFVQR